MHIIQSIILRKYIPALATSILCLPIGIFIVIESFYALVVIFLKRQFGLLLVLFTVVGNLMFARRFAKKIIMKFKN